MKSSDSNKELVQVGDERGQWVQVPAGYQVVMDQDPPEETEVHLWDHVAQLWQRRWLILVLFIACLGAAVLIARQRPVVPLFRAVATIRVGVDQSQMDPLAGEGRRTNSPDLVHTHAQVLRSRTLALRVINRLNLYGAQAADQSEAPIAEPVAAIGTAQGYMALASAWLERGKSAILGPAPVLPQLDPAVASEQRKVDAFLMSLGVHPIPNTQIIEITYTSTDPNMSAGVLNTLLEEYVQYDLDARSNQFAMAREWASSKLGELKLKLEESEKGLLSFVGSDSEEFLTLAQNGTTRERQIEETRGQLAAAEDELRNAQYRHAQVQKQDQPELAIQDPAYQQVRRQLEQAEAEHRRLLAYLTPTRPEVVEQAEVVANLRRQLDQERQRIETSHRLEHERALARRDELAAKLTAQQEHYLSIQQRVSDYNILQRDVDLNKSFYENLLQRWKELGLSEGMNVASVSIMQHAVPPLRPTNSGNRTIVMGALLGLMLGVGAAFGLNQLDMSFRNAQEVSRIMRLPILGFIPFCESGRRQRRKGFRPELATHLLPYSGVADSFRSLRTGVNFTLGLRKSHLVLVTSSLPVEGKTTVATNLAISMAQRGRRVLLVDGDLKKPTLHKVFGVEPSPGLTDLLTNSVKENPEGGLGDPIRATGIGNLYLLTGGGMVGNPLDLLDSEEMRRLLHCFGEEFDNVVIDSAPVTDIADTGVLGPYVDGVVMVVCPGRTPRRVVKEAREKLAFMGANILGVVINYTQRKVAKRYGSGFQYRSGFGYGYGYAEAGRSANGNGAGQHPPVLKQPVLPAHYQLVGEDTKS